MRTLVFLLITITPMLFCNSMRTVEKTKNNLQVCDEESAKQIFLKKIKSIDPGINIKKLIVKTEYWDKEKVFFLSVTTDSLYLLTKGYISIVNRNDCTIKEFVKTM